MALVMSEEKVRRAMEKLRPIFSLLPDDYTGPLKLEMDFGQGGLRPKIGVTHDVVTAGKEASDA